MKTHTLFSSRYLSTLLAAACSLLVCRVSARMTSEGRLGAHGAAPTSSEEFLVGTAERTLAFLAARLEAGDVAWSRDPAWELARLAVRDAALQSAIEVAGRLAVSGHARHVRQLARLEALVSMCEGVSS